MGENAASHPDIGQDFVTVAGEVVARPFAAFYAGDYDGSAWLYNQLKSKWDDPRRGQVGQ